MRSFGQSWWLRGLLFVLIGLLVLPTPAFANAAEPPNLVLIVTNAPADLEIATLVAERNRVLKKSNLFEDQFGLYGLDTSQPIELIVRTQGQEKRLTLALPKMYSNVYQLDLETDQMTPGRPLSRTVMKVGLRLGLTLLIEGVILWLFGYRKLKSWLIFLVINLVTQGYLAYGLSQQHAFVSYPLLGLIVAEFIIFVVEMAVYGVVLREPTNQSKPFRQHYAMRAISYGLVANLASFLLGYYLLAQLGI